MAEKSSGRASAEGSSKGLDEQSPALSPLVEKLGEGRLLRLALLFGLLLMIGGAVLDGLSGEKSWVHILSSLVVEVGISFLVFAAVAFAFEKRARTLQLQFTRDTVADAVDRIRNTTSDKVLEEALTPAGYESIKPLLQNRPVIRKQIDISFILEPVDEHPDYLKFRVDSNSIFVNNSNIDLPWAIGRKLFIMYENISVPQIHTLSWNGERVSPKDCDVEDEVKDGYFRVRKEVTMPANTKSHSHASLTMIRAINDGYDFSLRDCITRQVTISVQPPDNLEVVCSIQASTGDSSTSLVQVDPTTWISESTILPSQTISLQWWKKGRSLPDTPAYWGDNYN